MLTDKDNPKVQEQYEKWVYPDPVKDLDAWQKTGHFPVADPGRSFNLFWPNREKKPLRILVAGCGAHQAAHYALLNRDCQVTGIDFSSTSVQHTKFLKDRHKLKNLTVLEMSLFDVGKLEGRFDFIVSTGVLHHLPDPVAGGQALVEMLEKDGVMSLMLYGSTLRAGVYMLQEAFRALKLEQTQPDIDLLKLMKKFIPERHAIQKYPGSDWNFDGGLVDTFLHPQDRAYSVAGIYDFAEAIGLKFRGWLDNGDYALDNYLPQDFPALHRLKSLSLKDQAIFVDNFCQLRGTHRFNLCHSAATGYEIGFHGNEWMNYVPIKHIALRLDKSSQYSQIKTPVWRRLGHAFSLGHFHSAMMENVDGKKTVKACFEQANTRFAQDPEKLFEIAQVFFLTMWERGHLFYRKN